MDRGHVFISYDRKDAAFVRRLTKRLEGLELSAWSDLSSLRPGDDWLAAIDDAIRAADAVLVVLSPNSARSRYVAYEWAFALGAGRKVIPVVINKTSVHPRLRTIQYVDFTRPGKAWLRLLDVLHAANGPAPEIRAEFELRGGRPRMEGDAYVILLSIDRAPQRAYRVDYRVHDRTFDPDRWAEVNPTECFTTWMQSYGDVLISANIQAPTDARLVEITLFEALRRRYGETDNPAIRKALRSIERH